MQGISSGLGVRELARKLGVSPPRVVQIRAALRAHLWVGNRPAWHVTQRGAEALDRFECVMRMVRNPRRTTA